MGQDCGWMCSGHGDCVLEGNRRVCRLVVCGASGNSLSSYDYQRYYSLPS